MAAKHGKSAPILKPSYLTPPVPTMTQESAVAAGGKKRNKLGYHRRSIACSHCRRRKTRCIVSPEIQNRCINCIRLKKDCSFCPVGQLPTVDTQDKPAGPGTGSSTANSQSSSSALAFRQPVGMASRSMYGTGPRQDSNGHATLAVVPSSVEYPSVTGEGRSMPISSTQNFGVSAGTSLAGGSAEPNSVRLPGSMDMGYEWRPYGNESGSTEQISPFALVSTAPATWATTMPGTPQFSDWNWNNGILPTTQAISVFFSGEVMSHPQHQFVPVSSKSPYSGAVPNMRNTFTLPMNQASGAGHLPSQACDLSGGWQLQQQLMLPTTTASTANMGFKSWGIPHDSGPPM